MIQSGMHGRSINESQSNDCRSYECRSNDCRSNETTPLSHDEVTPKTNIFVIVFSIPSLH